MCDEYERDRDVQVYEEQAREEIRRLFERYREIGRRERPVATEAAVDKEPALTAR